MKGEEMRGSAKLMEMLGGEKGQLSEAAMAKAFGVSAEQFTIDRVDQGPAPARCLLGHPSHEA